MSEKRPLIVMPPVYEIPLGVWRWCRIEEVCWVASGVASLAGISFRPTAEDLVSNFAALIRPNVLPDDEGKKLFRFSPDGFSLGGTEVPTKELLPHVPFRLNIVGPYPNNMYVKEDWVADVLEAIRKGATSAVDYGDRILGFPPKESKKGLISLGGKKETIAILLP